MNHKTAAILSIGNELLKGKTVNTNASELARKLTFAGYTVKRMLVVADEPSEIGQGFKLLIGECDVLVSTGGLGPTFDDMTVESFANAFGYHLVEDHEALETLKKRYTRVGVELTPERLKMIMKPEGSVSLQNPAGAAPGVMIERTGTKIIILPGVPKECMAIIDSVLPSLRVPGVHTLEKSLTIDGVMESAIAPVVKRAMKIMDDTVYVKTHPMRSETENPRLEIEVSATAQTEEEVSQRVEKTFSLILKDLEKSGLSYHSVKT